MATPQPAPKAERFIKLPEWLLGAEGISLRAKVVMAALLNHREFRGCDPTQKDLALKVGIGLATVERALAELRKAGWIMSRRDEQCRYGIRLEPLKVRGSNPSICGVQTPQGEGFGRAHPYLYIDKEEKSAARSVPSKKNKPSNAPLPPRKSAQSEVLEAYYREERRKAAGK